MIYKNKNKTIKMKTLTEDHSNVIVAKTGLADEFPIRRDERLAPSPSPGGAPPPGLASDHSVLRELHTIRYKHRSASFSHYR